jgi:polysaccharide pyruvyl transferase WcaK-like protein
MHLAIAALSQAVPVGAISYKDRKFDGLFKHFELAGFTLPPSVLLRGDEVFRFVTRLIECRQQLRHRIRERLPFINQLAMSNFDWIGRLEFHCKAFS